MKKTITNIIIIITFLIIYLLQTNFFNWFNIAGIKPNLYIIFILFLGLFAGRKVGSIYGIIFGIVLDLLTKQNIGITSIMLGVIGYLGGYFDKNFSKENRITIMLMGVGATIIFELGAYLINAIIISYDLEIWQFIKILSIEVIYNILITIVIYPILQNAGYYIEEIFKSRNSNLLTRYF